MNKMRKMMQARKNQKGFTLVEVIVVLVILAILAAIAIPSLTGYIDKAKEKTDIAEARNALMAAQTLASEAYAAGTTDDASESTIKKTNIEGLTGTLSAGSTVVVDEITKGKITKLTFTGATSKCVWNGTTWDVSKIGK